jgi:predicted alpha/beta-hydrolase family hydrolase
MATPFMETFASLLAERGVAVLRFEFAYMRARGEGIRRPAPKAGTLQEEYRAAVAAAGGTQKLLIGGKSMGGRVASMLAEELFGAGRIAGLVCLGYPFHPPTKPAQLRTAHLEHLRCPALIVQGTRDPFGTRDEVEGYCLSPAIRVHWIEDGDHDLKRRRAMGHAAGSGLVAAADAVATFAAAQGLDLPAAKGLDFSRGKPGGTP